MARLQKAHARWSASCIAIPSAMPRPAGGASRVLRVTAKASVPWPTRPRRPASPAILRKRRKASFSVPIATDASVRARGVNSAASVNGFWGATEQKVRLRIRFLRQNKPRITKMRIAMSKRTCGATRIAAARGVSLTMLVPITVSDFRPPPFPPSLFWLVGKCAHPCVPTIGSPWLPHA